VADIKIFNPEGLAKPPGTYTHIAQARTQQVVFIAGQVPSDASGKTVGKGDIEAQSVQVYANILTALRAVGANFRSVNIFEEPEIREALKRFSNWPTYPQLYVNGELVGGCDIALEMYRSGELKKLLSEVGATAAA